MGPLPHPAARTRRAVATIFFINGAVLASWVAHVPAVKARHGLTDDRLGLLLLSMAAGSVLALPLAGWLIARWGSRLVTSAAALAFCVSLPLPVAAPSIVMVAVALFAMGALNATLDVSMNAQAIGVEKSYRRPIMSSFHALFSGGGVVGAVAASAAMAAGATAQAHLAAVALIASALVARVLPALLPSGRSRSRAAKVFAWPPAALVVLGLLSFCALLAEGAMGDWSAVYLHDSLHTTSARAATGFAAFSLAMAAGRCAGDRLTSRLGPRRLLRVSAAIAAAGLTGALVLATPWAALVGFAMAGFGIANVIPVLFSTAGRVRTIDAGTALAGIATTGYAGYLAGPPLIGFAASRVGLPTALGIVVAAGALIGTCAGMLPDGHAGEPGSPDHDALLEKGRTPVASPERLREDRPANR